MTQTQTLGEFINQHFGGVLRRGTHAAGGQVCAIEALNAYHGRDWTDDPAIARIWDLRPLNDIPWLSNAERTAHLLPLLVAYDGCRDWPLERQRAVMERIAVETVRQLVSGLPGLSAGMQQHCRECDALDSARSGAEDAYAEASSQIYGAPYGGASSADEAAARYATARTIACAADDAADAAANAAFADDDLSDERARYHYACSACGAASAAAAAVRANRDAREAVLVTACDIWLAATVTS